MLDHGNKFPTGTSVTQVTMTSARTPVEHIFTVDVEEYFQVGAFEGIVSREEWTGFPSRIEESMDAVFSILEKHGAKGTFFTLGWIAERYPAIVRRIHDLGHEVASHGFWHRRVDSLTPDEFREDVRSSKVMLENACGAPVTGFRAPNFSIKRGGEWAFDILLEEGYQYDSSLFPIRRPGYGYPSAPTIPHLIHRKAGSLCELPLATTRWRGMRVPAAGGAYLRHFPYSIVRRAMREYDESGIPATFYIHPWELDPAQPRISVPLHTRIRHYGGLNRTVPRLDRLLREFRFTSARECLQLHPPAPPLAAKVSSAAD